MDYTPILFENPMDLLLKCIYIGNVLKHIRAKNDIKGITVKWDFATIVVDNRPNAILEVIARRKINRADDITSISQIFRLPSRSRANLKYPAGIGQQIEHNIKFMPSSSFELMQRRLSNP